MDTTWHVDIRVKAPGDSTSEDSLFMSLAEDVLETLEDLSAVASVDESTLHVGLAIDRSDPVEAIAAALGRVNEALAAAGVTTHELVYASLQEWGDFERDLDEPTFPPLVGIAEIARMAGVSRQRASQLARSSDFPEPHGTLASGPVWFEPNVVRFVEAWERKPGRPRRAAAG